MSDTVAAIPTFGFARGAIVRCVSGGPNMLVVRDLMDTVCVVRCEGDEAGTLRLREEPKCELVQVLDHDGRHPLDAEHARLTARIAELEKALKPFADCAKYLPQRPDDAIPDDVAAFDMGDGRFWTLQDTSFFEARTTLSASQDKGDES